MSRKAGSPQAGIPNFPMFGLYRSWGYFSRLGTTKQGKSGNT